MDIVAELCQITPRQVSYYSLVANDWGLLKIDNKNLIITEKGVIFNSLTSRLKRKNMCIYIIQMEIIKLLINKMDLNGSLGLCKQDIAEIIRDELKLSESTAWRRTGTIWKYFEFLEQEKMGFTTRYGRVSKV